MINFIGNRKIYYIIAAVCMAAICLFAVIMVFPWIFSLKAAL